MPSNIDIQKVMRAMDETKMVNLDVSLRDVVESDAVSMLSSVAHLEPWDLICYTWITFIRRRPFNELVIPVEQLLGSRLAERSMEQRG